jgi:hypothetical protein
MDSDAADQVLMPWKQPGGVKKMFSIFRVWSATEYLINTGEKPVALAEIDETDDLVASKMLLALPLLPRLECSGKKYIERVIVAIPASQVNLETAGVNLHPGGFQKCDEANHGNEFPVAGGSSV